MSSKILVKPPFIVRYISPRKKNALPLSYDNPSLNCKVKKVNLYKQIKIGGRGSCIIVEVKVKQNGMSKKLLLF